MTNCWQYEAETRPSFRELHRTISRLLEINQVSHPYRGQPARGYNHQCAAG